MRSPLGKWAAISAWRIPRRGRSHRVPGVHGVHRAHDPGQSIYGRHFISLAFRADAVDLLPRGQRVRAAEGACFVGLGAHRLDALALYDLPLHHDGDPVARVGGRFAMGDRSIFAKGRACAMACCGVLLDNRVPFQAHRDSPRRSLSSVVLLEEAAVAAGLRYRGGDGGVALAAAGNSLRDCVGFRRAFWQSLAHQDSASLRCEDHQRALPGTSQGREFFGAQRGLPFYVYLA